ncbi:MAG: Spy/CpxP family protein refolding chaperone [Candidatus Omnitrophota bacterium]
MNKIKKLLILLAVVAMAAGTAYAPQKCKDNHQGGDRKGRIFEKLNLTPEQQKSLEGNRKIQREKMKELRAAMKEKQEQLQQALREPSADKASVEPIVNEIKTLQAQSLEYRIDGILAVKQILTPEQYAQFQQMVGKYKEGRKGRFQDWRKKGKFHTDTNK